jgi:poly(hydroxyalkanoate) granule-associated protein
MSETQTRQDMATELRDGLMKTGRDMWLASLGMMAAVGEEARTVFETLVERGKAVEARRDTTTVGRAMGDMQRQIREFGQRIEDGVQETSRAVLHRFGVPSHGEVQTLITRVEQLSAKVDTIAHKEVADVQET